MMMNDFRFYSKDFLLDFLKVYKSMPSLWQLKHPEYSNKDKKNKDFEILIKKMKEIEPRADRNCVLNRISNLRSVYKRECKRLMKLQPNKKSEELVSDTVWYFEHLHFLQDNKPRSAAATVSAEPTAAKATITKTTITKKSVAETETETEEATKTLVDEVQASVAQSQEAEEKTSKRKAGTAGHAVDNDEDHGDVSAEPQAKIAKLQQPNVNEENTVKLEDHEKLNNMDSNREFIKDASIIIPDLILKAEPEEPTINTPENAEHDDSDDLLSEIGCSTFNSDHANSDRMERNQNFEQLMQRNNFDRFDHMTTAWAGILRNLTRSQQIFAEKLINDVLFEAQLENLSRESTFIASVLQKVKQNGYGNE